MAMSSIAGARQVDTSVAKYIAQSMLSSKGVKSELHDVTPAVWQGSLYLYSGGMKGFVLVSADDAVRPVLAYSTEAAFPTEEMPAPVQAFIQGYADVVDYARRHRLPQHPMWKELLSAPGPRAKDGNGVGPLVTSAWGQGYPYNNLCPVDPYWEDSPRSATGCVATAMAQVMRYWQWPEQGWGQHTYDCYTINIRPIGTLSEQFDTVHYRWELMPDRYDSLSTDAQNYAVSRLMYDCGVAMNMRYSSTGSGASLWGDWDALCPSASEALRTYFRYHPSLQGVDRFNYSDAEWMDLMLSELNAGRPMLYAATSASMGSHAIVVDGYDADHRLHFNFGWSGRYDGFYAVDSIWLTDNLEFLTEHTAVIGIRPNTDEWSDSVTIEAVAADPHTGYCTGGGQYAYADTVCLTAHAAEGYRFDGWSYGSYENPRLLPATASLDDTARFRPIGADTLAYCTPRFRLVWNAESTSGITRWGIRIPASLLHDSRWIEAVQFYKRYVSVDENDTLRLNIHSGCFPGEGAPVYEHTYVIPQESTGWVTLAINEPVAIDTTGDLWISFVVDSGTFFVWPITGRSTYGGRSDGCWFYNQDGWQTLDSVGIWSTWMIRALTTTTCPPIAIGPVAEPEMKVAVAGAVIQVDLPQEVASLSLYDVTGRHLQTVRRCRQATFTVPTPGVYLVYPQAGVARRVVVPSF